MQRNRILWLILALVGLLAATTGAASSQAPVPTPADDDVNRVAKQMYCPVCENIPLDVCPTQACNEWRELIRQRLSEGWTDEQIKQYFAAQYGDRVLAAPPRRGLNWLVYVLPPVVFLSGVILLWRVLASMKKHTSPLLRQIPPINQENEDPYLKQLEEELRKNG